MTHARETAAPGLAFLLALGLCLAAYWPGLGGAFLFDDIPNLSNLGSYQAVDSLHKLSLYLASGFSGPTGRPVSLLSFLINDNTWPSAAYSFKYTNLLLHLLTGCLLCLVSFRLLRLSYPDLGMARTAWVAVLSASLWLLHPFFVSTTLYVVQRMAQLSALFTLAGVLGYLHGRSLLVLSPRRGYAWMTVSLGLGTMLAVLSKENGILLTLLVLVIEVAALSQAPGPGPHRLWKAGALWLPSLAILGYLAQAALKAPQSYVNRSFSLAERLLTEGRILIEYLTYLVVPRSHTRGLFHDSYVVSSDWLTPATTLIAWLAIAVLLALAVGVRRRYPILSLAILFFFAGHVLESTVLPLELYFEHRNYLPAMFLFLPVAAGAVSLYSRRPAGVGMAASGLVLILTGVTWQHASLWGQPAQLVLVWAEANPSSVRAQGLAAEELARQGRPDLAEERLRRAIATIPDRPALRVQLLLHTAVTEGTDPDDVRGLLDAIGSHPYDSQVANLVGILTGRFLEGGTRGLVGEDLLDLLRVIGEHPDYAGRPAVVRIMEQLQGLIYAHQSDSDRAIYHFRRALEGFKSVETGLAQTAVLATGGFYEAALDHLALAEAVLEAQESGMLRRSRESYRQEISRLRRTLLEDSLGVARADPGPVSPRFTKRTDLADTTSRAEQAQ